jgi:oxygen-independent coproporphyrinogen III oxidase
MRSLRDFTKTSHSYQNKHIIILAGLYIHIPFCRKACHYCNFHFSTSMKSKSELVVAIAEELELQKDYLKNEPLETIYFGGGTPSVLTATELNFLFDKIYTLYKIAPNPEITLEANPDDLNFDYLKSLRAETPINRLSIGIQSFAEEDLRWMNRAHNAIEARMCIEYAQDAGFDNLTVDLIYGSPTTTDEQWLQNLQIVFDYDIPHISCYALTVEEGTALDNFVKKGKRPNVDEERAARHFEMLMDEMRRNGFLHYEISNFALPDRFARHNSNYWLGATYLGVGPSAHSFDGVSRQWNVAHNPQYVKALRDGNVPFTREDLTTTQRYNEYVMTTLRTIWGCDPIEINARFGKEYLKHFNQKIMQPIKNQTVTTDGKKYFLSDKGKLLADRITMELFY